MNVLPWRRCVGIACVMGGVLALGAGRAGGQEIATSTFDLGPDGWQLVTLPGDDPEANPLVYPIDWSPTGGNPGGYVSHHDPDSQTSYFDAPSPFLGDIAAAYGHPVMFDLRVTDANPVLDTDLLLRGAGLTLVLNFDNPIPGSWNSYSLLLHEGAGWIRWSDGMPASQADLMAVLSSLDSLRIRGEFFTGIDTGDLDNVILVPEPSTAVLLALTCVGALWRRRRM